MRFNYIINILLKLFLPILLILLMIGILHQGKVTIDDIAVELLSAVAFPIAFFLIQNAFTPKMWISPFVVRNERMDAERRFLFKAINVSLTSIRDVKISARVISISKSGVSMKAENYPIPTDFVEQIPSPLSCLTRKGSCAILITMPQEFENLIMDETKTFELRVECKDSFVGRSKLFSITYRHLDKCVRNGRFKSGITFDIETNITEVT